MEEVVQLKVHFLITTACVSEGFLEIYVDPLTTALPTLAIPVQLVPTSSTLTIIPTTAIVLPTTLEPDATQK